MSHYSKKHYREVGSLLGKSKATKKDVDNWVKRFKKDNPLFKPKVFREYVKRNRPKSKKKKNPCKRIRRKK